MSTARSRFEVTEETLGFEAVRETVAGAGHFLGADHTMAAMQRDYFYPTLADREDPLNWAENGAPTLWQRAGQRAKEVLDGHFPIYLDGTADKKIQRTLRHQLPKERMRPG